MAGADTLWRSSHAAGKGGRMLDFTSSLYLGFRHPNAALPRWPSLTTGRPAALEEGSGSRAVARALADLQGCERTVLAPSTLHLFWDLFGMLDRQQAAIFLDSGTYPIARWGVERAAGRGLTVETFAHHDSADLWRRAGRRGAGAPIVVSDGFCPACGRPAPLRDYLEIARSGQGTLVLDDTQALGILGAAPGKGVPCGYGGGGSLPWHGISGPGILVVSSLAKAFGAPIAALAGSAEDLRRFEERSETRVHSSGPSAAAIGAAERAVALNRQRGDELRLRLLRRIRAFQARLSEAGYAAEGGWFPVQTLGPIAGIETAALYRRLLALGVRAVLRREHNGTGARISLLMTARSEPAAIEEAVAALQQAVAMDGMTTHQAIAL